MNSYYEGIIAVKELDTPTQVNEHLKDQTWRLVKIAEITTSQGAVGGGVLITTKLVYIVGLKDGAPERQPARLDTPPKAAAQSTDSSTGSTKTTSGEIEPPAFSSADLEGLADWTESKFGGMWIPKDQVPAEAAKFLKAHGERTEKGSYKVKRGEFTFVLSASGNLNRYGKENGGQK